LDTFRQTFTPPAECLKANVLKCPNQQVNTWEKQHFKHDHALRQVQAAKEPDQPHLAQAWTAMSSGDGLPGQTGKESYYISSDKKFKAHKFEYPDAGCTKISLHDPTQLHHIAGGERNYYLGCDAVNCCYSDFQMKEWDIEKAGLFTHVDFIGIEDTTELNDNPVQGAEHWRQTTTLPIGKGEKIGIGYEYYLHRTDSADVISHRIDYNVSGADVPSGSILYGDFQPQHDLDTFRQTFTPPAECLKANVLKCPNQQVNTWEKQHFKLDHALRQMHAEVVV